MRNKIFTLLIALLYAAVCNAQEPSILHGDLMRTGFVGYDNGFPVFYKIADGQGLYQPVRLGSDSLRLQRVRTSKLPVWSSNTRLTWINNDIEIYTIRRPQPDVGSWDFVIITKDRIDTVAVKLSTFYQRNYEPFAITSDRKTLFAVQPSAHQDDDLGWYYDNIIKIDLTKNTLVAEQLPITGVELQIVDSFLYYKGGSGNLQNAILRVEIGSWDKVDTLAMHSHFWFVYNDILFAEIGRYSTQDVWFGENRFIAYSIVKRANAIVAKEPPVASDRQPILFEGKYYNCSRGGLHKLLFPTITEFIYKQTFPR